jgi:hypothetical protein
MIIDQCQLQLQKVLLNRHFLSKLSNKEESEKTVVSLLYWVDLMVQLK